MFDVGFWEVALIGVIALLVVGPERLPALARNVGLWVGRIRRYVTHVKQDIEREIHAEEVRELINKPSALKETLGSGFDDLKDMAKETTQAVHDLKSGLDEAAREGDSPAPETKPETNRESKLESTDSDEPPAAIATDTPATPTTPFDAQQLKPGSESQPAANTSGDAVGNTQAPASENNEQVAEQPRRD